MCILLKRGSPKQVTRSAWTPDRTSLDQPLRRSVLALLSWRFAATVLLLALPLVAVWTSDVAAQRAETPVVGHYLVATDRSWSGTQ